MTQTAGTAGTAGIATGTGQRRVEAFAALVAAARAQPPRLGPVRVVAIDGHNGAGKTVFARRLARHAQSVGTNVAVVATDELLDGWHDTVTFWHRLEAQVLAPLRNGRDGAYRAYDWASRRFGSDITPVPVPELLILDGVTAARREIRPELACGVFVTAPPWLRLDRSLARDGPGIRTELLGWRRREEAFFGADRTMLAADLIVDGAPAEPHDAEREYVRLQRKAVGPPDARLWASLRSGA
jgi:hypothetical protein